MARTRGASPGVVHMDAGELLGRDGEPLPTRRPDMPPPPPPILTVALAASAEPVASARASTCVFECGPDTWRRNMDGWAAMHLLNAMFVKLFDVELSVTFTQEEYEKLSPDLRLNCQRRTVS